MLQNARFQPSMHLKGFPQNCSYFFLYMEINHISFQLMKPDHHCGNIPDLFHFTAAEKKELFRSNALSGIIMQTSILGLRQKKLHNNSSPDAFDSQFERLHLASQLCMQTFLLFTLCQASKAETQTLPFELYLEKRES